jgi:hypothetical protein
VAIVDKLNSQWTSKEQGAAVFEYRAAAQNAYQVLIETVSRLDALGASSKFTTVDAEIKTTGIAVRKIINDAKVLLDAHADFLNWRQP